jgi:predicted nucleic acid-binding Zn ribbon protein
MEKLAITHDPEKKTLAFVMFLAGILVWFLIDVTKPLAHDLVKAIAFFLFGYGMISLSKWKKWSELSSREKKMRIAFFIILALILVAVVILLFIWK